MNSLYTVGGILNPSWSIGVEEQFYLVWAPAVKRVRERLPALCWAVLGLSLALFCLSHWNVFGYYEWKKFVGQLKFHFMAAGALSAWFLHRRREALLRLPPFASRFVQLVLFALLADFYLLSTIPWGWLGEEILQVVLYSWIIVNLAANPRNVLPIDNRAFDYLGTISYGIYMFHMVAVYATSLLFKSTSWWRGNLPLFCLAYYGCVFTLTFLLAHFSYRYFERPFLRLKDRRFSLPTPAVSAPASAPAATLP
jgi:peptidoglycan/LPS O-acetylase OafA/YrhL